MMPLLRTLQALVLEYAAERKRQGRAEFHDLLVWTRDLLRDNIEVRDHFRQRFSHLLIDEAQDTDPIQAEIAMFLAEDTSRSPEPASGQDRPRTWEQVRPVPGKLFVVGDPKQSIYRFRRADVAQMGRLRERLQGDTVRLVQNFRSHQPVLAWVNHVFQQWMIQGEQQTEYVSVTHRWEVTTDHACGPRVWRLGEALEEGHIDRVRQREAREIAALLRSIVRNQWQVLDPLATGEAGRERYRNAAYADICILMPRRTALRSLELALDRAGLPYRLEGASLIFGTQEVRDLINCLRAIDDPADQVALVAALRSPAFACSDVDLLEFVQAGGKLDYLDPAGDRTGRVAEGFPVLERFHQDRLWTAIPALIDRFLRDRLLLEAALDHPRTREQWRRYRFMVEQARAFAAAGGNSLRSFLDWVERQAAEGARVTEVPVPEGDESAVRIMTVHAAKGLEFPVVVLTGLNSGDASRVDGVLFDRRGGAVEVKTGPAAQSFSTPGYEDLAEGEKARDQEELVRLLYVAATRARDHLVLSMYRKSNDGNSAASTIAGLLDGEDGLWEPIGELPADPAEVDEASSAAGNLDRQPEEHTAENHREWLKGRESTLHRQSQPVAVAATTLARIAKEEVREEVRSEEPWKKGRGGTSLGRAVHAVLQTADLATGRGLEATARAQATAEGIYHREGEVLALARAALASPVVKRAVAARRLWREVPVAAPLDGHIIEGIIDLLFEEGDGLVVVDYKTDAIGAGETQDAVDRYRIQGGVYALALERATGRPVKEVVFLFLQPRKEESIVDVDRIKELAAVSAAAYWSPSGAIG
jgi:ATP-dependent exoDNAse (exonuclease V) beta subunit